MAHSGYGRREVVEFLLANDASIQACDEGGLHPLHNACSFGHADVVRLLLGAGASPNTTDNWNYTPLHEAASKGKIDVCIGKWLYLSSSFMRSEVARLRTISSQLKSRAFISFLDLSYV